MTHSQWRHAVQWVAEVQFGARQRAQGHAERAAFNAALSQRPN